MRKKTISLSKKKGARLGQHLLVSRDIARAVAEAANIHDGDVVLEIGPGGGILTRELLRLGAQVIAVEKDSSFVKILSENFYEEIRDNRLEVIHGDIRTFLSTFPFPLSTPYKVSANIPYYITGEIIRLLLTAKHQPNTISLLVQKEVAERIARATKESLLSLSVKAYGEPAYMRTVKAGSFNPPPSVDSAILAIKNISRHHFSDASEETFFQLLHLGFGQKRKTLLGNLKKSGVWSVEKVEKVFAEIGLGLKVRAEDMSLQEWLTLTKAF